MIPSGSPTSAPATSRTRRASPSRSRSSRDSSTSSRSSSQKSRSSSPRSRPTDHPPTAARPQTAQTPARPLQRRPRRRRSHLRPRRRLPPLPSTTTLWPPPSRPRPSEQSGGFRILFHPSANRGCKRKNILSDKLRGHCKDQKAEVTHCPRVTQR